MSDLTELQNNYESLKNEYQICERKLISKCDALMILSRELDECRGERDQFKLMAEHVQERYHAVRRRFTGIGPESSVRMQDGSYADMENQCLARLLCEAKDTCKSHKFSIDDLTQKLKEAHGDIKLLREQIARQRVGTTDEGINIRHFPAYERQDLISRLEASTEKYSQLQRDLQQVIDEKEELETERDAYKTKYERLNNELNHILKGDESRIIDIDALVTENKFLNDRLKQMEEERSTTTATVAKYKSMLEKKKMKGVLKLGQSRSGGAVITHRQVRQLLDESNMSHPSPQALADLHALASALLETVNDKNLVLSHQRKANKILGNRVSELERKLKTLEVSGLWNMPDNAQYLERLRMECEEVKTLIPATQSSDASQDGRTHEPHDTPHTSPTHSATSLDHELDLLPTKENVVIEAAAVVNEERRVADDSQSFDMESISSSHDNATNSDRFILNDDSTTTEKLSVLMGKITNIVIEQTEKAKISEKLGPTLYASIDVDVDVEDDDNDSVECKLLAKISPEHKAAVNVKNIEV